jgi:hypothetical protein
MRVQPVKVVRIVKTIEKDEHTAAAESESAIAGLPEAPRGIEESAPRIAW